MLALDLVKPAVDRVDTLLGPGQYSNVELLLHAAYLLVDGLHAYDELRLPLVIRSIPRDHVRPNGDERCQDRVHEEVDQLRRHLVGVFLSGDAGDFHA